MLRRLVSWGSQAVAKDYRARSVEVFAISQFDMTTWAKRGTKGHHHQFHQRQVDPVQQGSDEEDFSITCVETKCDYACSDHASWERAGYPAVFTIESSFANSNQNIHSANE